MTHHMSLARNYKRLFAELKLSLPVLTSEICNYLLRMRKMGQRKDYITHCLQVIVNAYMRYVGKIGQLLPQKHEITFCACVKRFRGSTTSHVACIWLHTPTCEISAISVNWFLRNMKLPSAHARNGSEEALHPTSTACYYTRLFAKFQPYRPIGSSEKCNCLLRMRTTVQSKFNIKHCLQVIVNTYMR